MSEEIKKKVLEQLSKKPWYTRELAKVIGIGKKELDEIVKELIDEGKAAYWSSGSTTYVTTKEKLEELEKKRTE